jgi:hypothetical protein
MPNVRSYEGDMLAIFNAHLPRPVEAAAFKQLRADCLQDHDPLDYARMAFAAIKTYQEAQSTQAVAQEEFNDQR